MSTNPNLPTVPAQPEISMSLFSTVMNVFRGAWQHRKRLNAPLQDTEAAI